MTETRAHPEPEELAAFGLGRLGESDSARIARHLAGCEACASVVADVPADAIVTLIRDRAADGMRTNTMRLQAGYEILEEIGRGGMGVVFKARQRGTTRLVALKRLTLGAAAGADDLRRFRREAEAAGRLQHPNIVRVYDCGEQDGEPYLALEYLAGESLARFLTHSHVEPARSARLIEKLARAVQYAHDRRIVHRDLKPGNILLEGDDLETAKIADFGLAKRLDADSQSQTGNLIGTPSYMAPEQAAGSRDVGPVADVYSLGAILYELLTGRPPFRSAATLETLEQVRTQPPVPPARLVPSIPRDLETICLKCLEKEPAKRYPTAVALAEDLRRFQAGEPILARRAGYAERAVKWCRRNPASTLAIAFTALGLGGAIAGLAWHNRQLQRAVERAELGEAEARKQKSQALATYHLGHDALDETVLNLIQGVGDFDDDHSRAVRREQALLALHYYDEALRHFQADDPDYRFLRAKTLAYSAYLETVLDRYPAASDRYRQSIALFEGLIAEDPARPEYQRELGFCCSRFGYSLLETRTLDEAERQLNRARDLLLHLPQPDSDPGRTQWLLGFCYQRLTQLYDWKGDLPRAIENARLGTAVWRQLAGRDPDRVKFSVQLADMIRLTGFVTSRRDGPPATLTAARDVITVLSRFQDVCGVDWVSVRARYFLGDAYRHSAVCELNGGHSEQARAEATRGIRVIESLLKDHPGSSNGRACLYGLYRCRAIATPVPAESLSDWDEALTASHADLAGGCRIERARAYVAAGRHAYIGDECTALSRDPSISADQLFTLAVCFAECFASLDHPAIAAGSEEGRQRERYFAMALECLKRCQAAGGFGVPSRVAEVKEMPVFGGLRARPIFRDWLTRLDVSRSPRP